MKKIKIAKSILTLTNMCDYIFVSKNCIKKWIKHYEIS